MKRVQRLIPLLPPDVEAGNAQEYKIEDFQTLEILGSGAFATVFKVKHNSTKQIFAMKSIKKDIIRQARKIDQIKLEMEIMYSLNHEHVIKLYSHFEDEDHVNLLLEFIQGGNLYDQIKKHGTLREGETVGYMRQILSAIQFLHCQSRPILHRDIKPENILLDSNKIIKLADFGSANAISSVQDKRNTFTGTKIYMAVRKLFLQFIYQPEVLENVGYDQTVDIWSLGVLIFELLSGDTPFLPQDNRDTLSEHNQQMLLEQNIKNVKIAFPKDFPALARDLVRKMLKKDPAQRITIKEIIDHPWLKQQIEAESIKVQSETLTRQQRIQQSLNKFKERKNGEDYKQGKKNFEEVKRTIIELKEQINQYEIDIQKTQLENDELGNKLEEIERANQAGELSTNDEEYKILSPALDAASLNSMVISPSRIVKVEHQFNTLNGKIISMQQEIIEKEAQIAKNFIELDNLSNLEQKVEREKATVEKLEKELLSLDQQKKAEQQKFEEIYHSFTRLNKERSITLKNVDTEEQDEQNKMLPLIKAVVHKLKSVINLHKEAITNPQNLAEEESEEDEENFEDLLNDQLDDKLNELQQDYEQKKLKMRDELKLEMESLSKLEEENQRLKREARMIQEKEQVIEKAENILKNLDFSYKIKQEQIKELLVQKEQNEKKLQELQEQFNDEKRSFKMP